MDVYRVEKDGITFYVQPDEIAHYEALGYTIYKQVEEVVSDVETELSDSRNRSGIVLGEEVANG